MSYMSTVKFLFAETPHFDQSLYLANRICFRYIRVIENWLKSIYITFNTVAM